MSPVKVKRGRPSRATVAKQIAEGTDSRYKCPYCNRGFPRLKSLRVHERTHTGEKLYACTYPGCQGEFTQSGQLKTHIYRHTLEHPFRCGIEGCEQRFTHQNRQCHEHPECKLIRDGKEKIRDDFENLTESEIEWLLRYQEQKYAKQKEPDAQLLENLEHANTLLNLQFSPFFK